MAKSSHPHRFAMARRLIEMPLLLMAGPRTQSELMELFDVDRKTIWNYMRVLRDYWPVEQWKKGRYVYYRLPRNARPRLTRVGQR